MEIINISPHPLLAEHNRGIKIENLSVNFPRKEALLVISLLHFRGSVMDENIDNYIAPISLNLYTNNSKFVNNEGQRVDDDSENAIPEFDFLFSFKGAEQPEIGELMRSAIEFIVLRNDQLGYFNDFSNFP